MKESRQHPRVSIAVDVDVASGSNFYAGRTRDLSLGGLFVETDVGLPIGLQVDVKLKLPKGTFTVRCEVMWLLSEGPLQTVGVGVRFLELSPGAKRAIEAFMAIRSPLDFESPEADEDVHAGGPPPLPTNDGPPVPTAEARRKVVTPKAGPTKAKDAPPKSRTRDK